MTALAPLTAFPRLSVRPGAHIVEGASTDTGRPDGLMAGLRQPGAGPMLFGLLVGHTGYPAAFGLTAALMLAALPAARREHSAAASRPR